MRLTVILQIISAGAKLLATCSAQLRLQANISTAGPTFRQLFVDMCCISAVFCM
jgi:hypothetical protein